MTDTISAFDSAIAEADRLKRVLNKNKGHNQVRSNEERTLAKATALTWFNKHKPQIATEVSLKALVPLDEAYRVLLESSEHAATRKRYQSAIRDLRGQLVYLRSDCLALALNAPIPADQIPNFAPLIPDPTMQRILTGRWIECGLCITANASLAATVMMGGLLEALLLARINREANKGPVFTAKSSPKDQHGKTKQLKDWMLGDYIQVAHEMGWVSVSVRNVGEVLRDYRNYIHPYKQLTHGVHLTPDDSHLFWEVTKNIANQVIRSVA